MAKKTTIEGRKGGGGSARTPVEQPDDLQSIAKAKLLIALGEGEFAGGLTDQTIFLDGTPLKNSDGTSNFSGVAWEFRPGTQAQTYIQGMPGTENEVSVGTTLKSDAAWSHTFTNPQLSAIRLRLKWPSLFKQEDDGDLVGYSIKYTIELQTNGGAFKTVVDTAVTGKTTSGYERSHRIDLPQDGNIWTVRLRKVTTDANSAKIGDAMSLQSYTEVIDAKLRYPHTALLYIEFDSSQFNGSIPQIACEPKGRVIRVPDNYDPASRSYTGTWAGTFKWAWTDNPAWVFYDIVISDRFGLGQRLTAANIDKWELYRVAQYCDQPVPDGKGGSGTEPRYKCDVYVQDRNDAYTVLRDFAAIFRGMTYWGGNQIVTLADMPRDVDYSFTRANVIDGLFTYSSSTTKTRYTTALVSWTDPANGYANAMEPVFEQELVARYGYNQLEVTAIGCTRQSEANRKGRWGILTNNKDRVVTFSVGLDGSIPQPGYIIAVADEMLSGKVTGGRISAVNGRAITLDRAADAVAGDRLVLNLPGGASQSRTIQAVSGKVVTVTTAYTETPQAESVWVVESDQLLAQQYRVVSVQDNNDNTFTISAAYHDPDKYVRIDAGAVIDERPISVVPAGSQAAPADIQIATYSVVNQGISVQTMRVTWPETAGAISYEAQWRRNEGNWVTVPRNATTSFEVQGIYAGRYQVRVRAINAAEISSGWGMSDEVTLTGKEGNPPQPVGLMAGGLVFGVHLDWGFPAGTGDVLKTEIQYSTRDDGSDALLLADVPYPQSTYQQLGLKAGISFWYRAQLVDKSGNESGFTGWVMGQSSADAEEVLSYLTGQIGKTQLAQELVSDIGGKATRDEMTAAVNAAKTQATQQVNDAKTQATQQVSDAKAQAAQLVEAAKQQADQKVAAETLARINADAAEVQARSAAVQQEASARADALLSEKNARTADISQMKTLIQNGNESLAQQISQVAAGTGEQFDSLKIWHFDTSSIEGWTGQGTPTVTADGWLRPANHATDPYVVSPAGIAVNAGAYRFIKLRVKKVGSPPWSGQIRWVAAGQSFNNTQLFTVAEPVYDAGGVATLTVHDILWNGTGTIDKFRLDLTDKQDDSNYILFDWIAVGRPTPGAGMAALQDEATARVNADAAEAANRNTLAVQMRGAYTGNDAAQVSSGLIYSERQARVTADQAEVTARQALEASVNGSLSQVNTQLTAVSDKTNANSAAITGMKSDIAGKASADAVQSLTTRVTSAEGQLSSQGGSITQITASLARETKLRVLARGNGAGGTVGVFTADGQSLFSGGRSYNLVTFKTNADGSSAIATSATYDVFGTAATGVTLASDIAALAYGTQVLLYTHDEPRTNSTPVYNAIDQLGGTMALLKSVPYRGAYVLLGSKGAAAGTAIERVTQAGGDATALLNVPFTLVNGLIEGVGGGTGAMLSSAANAGAIQSLDTRVTKTEATTASQSEALTGLKNDLGGKASSDAVSRLTSRVESAENALTSQSGSMVSLTNTLAQQNRMGTNLWFDGSLESYADNQALTTDAVVVSGTSYSGSKSLRVLRPAGTGGNSDKDIGPDIAVKERGYYRLELWAMMPADQKPAAGWSLAVGVHSWNAAGAHSWRVGVSITEASLGGRDKWVKFSGVVGLSDAARARFWVSPRGQNGDGSPGYFVHLDNVTIVDITDAYAAQETADATATAMTALTTKVDQSADAISSQGTQLTTLKNDLATISNNVSKKADAAALQSLSNTVSQQGTSLAAQGASITDLTAALTVADREPENMMANGGFDGGVIGWSFTESAVNYQVDTSGGAAAASPACLRVLPGPIVNLEQRVLLKTGRRYRLSCSYRFASGSKIGAQANNKLRLGNVATNVVLTSPFFDVSKTDWTTASAEWLNGTAADIDATLGVQGVLTAGWLQIDSVYLADVTDSQKLDATAAATSALTTRVSNAEGVATSQGDAITSLKNTVQQQGTTLGQKADAAALNNYYTKTQADAAAAGQVSQYDATLQLGGTNLLADTGTFKGAAGIAAEVFKGNAVITLTRNAGQSGVYNDLFAPTTLNPALEGVYTASFWAKSSVKGTVVSCFFYSPNTTTRALSSQGVQNTNSDGGVPVTLSDKWERYWITWTQSATTTVKKLVFMRLTNPASGSVSASLSMPMLEAGSKVSDWSPAPEDVQTQLTANATAISGLSTRVSSAEGVLSSQSTSMTSLSNSIAQAGRLGSNPWFDGSLESYADNQALTADAVVVSGTAYAGAKSLRITRPAGTSGNSDKDIGPDIAVKDIAYYRLELWALMPADQAPAAGWSMAVGLHGWTQAGAHIWKVGFDITESALGGRDKWVKFNGVVGLSGAARARFWVSPRGTNGAGTPGYSVYLDNVTLTEITDAYVAQQTADANASATQLLTGRVTRTEQDVSAANSAVTQLRNDLTATNKEVATKATSAALQSLENSVSKQGTTLTAQGSSITEINAALSRETQLRVISRGNGSSGASGIYRLDGTAVAVGGRSFSLAVFKTEADGSASIASFARYDVFGSAATGKALSDAIAALANGTQVILFTADEPRTYAYTVAAAIESLGGTADLVSGLVYRSAYVLIGRKGMAPGTAIELVSPTGGDASAFVETPVTFLNGLIEGLGGGAGAMAKNAANATAIQGISSRVTQTESGLMAQGQSITSLTGNVNSQKATIDTLQTAVSTLDSSTATRIEEVKASNRNNAEAVLKQASSIAQTDASVSTLSKAVVAANGKIDASWQVKMNVTSDGRYVVAGIGVGISNETGALQSQILMTADRLALLPSDTSKNAVSPFVVENGQVYMNSAFIGDASITNAKIGDYIQSRDYAPGNSGWNVNKDGKAEFNNVTVRGKMYASEGELNNVRINESCTILGTLNASRINGPLMQAKTFSFYHQNTGQSSVIYWDGTAGKGDVPMTLSGTVIRTRNNLQIGSRVVIAGQEIGIASTQTADKTTVDTFTFSVDVGTGAETLALYAGSLNQGQGERTRWVVQIFASPTSNQFHT
ncbi:DUF1983 domain-containing protein [Erwinia sp. E602]|uniref:TipJ family phage tail tip protein n=1 Tax=Erwinia sp. E602 TaxID=2675378 RepID=UPI001BA5B8E5|nr:DUF1983 domain-containing protein [Erwinia sp. E602]QUG75484.1 DUF1983 domain-containing protein [Erwinia sp. E602]